MALLSLFSYYARIAEVSNEPPSFVTNGMAFPQVGAQSSEAENTF